MWGKSEGETYSHTFMDINCACETGGNKKTNMLATSDGGGREVS